MGVAHYLPQSALPEVPGGRGAAMARRPRGRAPAGSLLSRRLHPAGRDRRRRVPEQGRRLRPPVQDRRRDADHHRRRPEASGRAHRPHRRAPHLGLGADPSSARPRHRSRRRPVAGRVALDRLQARLLPAGARALAPVPPPLPRRARRRCMRPAASPSSAISRRSPTRRAFDAALAPLRRVRMGRLRQAAVRRTEGRARLSRALHPPRRDLQLAARRARREGRHLQMEGLPDQRPRPVQDHDARRRRVHPPLSHARAAERLPPHPPLRPVRRRGSRAKHRARPTIARRDGECARTLARRGRQSGRRPFAGAPLPLLRRPDDHHRNVRRRAPCATRHRRPGSGSTPHDRRRPPALSIVDRLRRRPRRRTHDRDGPAQPRQTPISRRRALVAALAVIQARSSRLDRSKPPRLRLIATADAPTSATLKSP